MNRVQFVSNSTALGRVMRRMTGLCAIVAFLGMSTLACAGIVVKIEDVTIASHPVNTVTGYFDVYVNYDGTNPVGAQMGAYNFRADLDGSATGFIALDLAIESNTLYASGRAPHFPGQNPSEFNSLPDQFIQVADNLPGINAQTPIINGRSLGTVQFTVQPGTTGLFPVRFNQGGQLETFLFDGQSNPHPIDLEIGSIRVIPEPATGMAAGAAIVVALLGLRRRSSRIEVA